MSIPAYMYSVKNLSGVFEAIRTAGVPERFTHTFLKQLGFASSSDRAIISVLKSLRFLDDNGTPTERYKRFRDPSLSGAVMAEAVRDAYGDLYTINQNAHSMNAGELKGAFLRLSGKGDTVAEKMTATFRGLAKLADWSSAAAASAQTGPLDKGNDDGSTDSSPSGSGHDSQDPGSSGQGARSFMPMLRHDIHVHLPSTTEVKVYDAIFRSLREHFG